MGDFDFSLYAEDITDNLVAIKEKIGKWREQQELNSSEAAAAKKEADKLIKETESTLSTFKDELNNLPAGDDKDVFTKQYKKFRKQLDDAKGDLSKKKEDSEDSGSRRRRKPADEVQAVPVEEKPKKKRGDEDDGGQVQKVKKYERGDNAMLDEAVDISNDTVKKLEEIKKMNEQTVEIGIEAAQRLKQQTEKMKEIQTRLDDLGAGTKRAKKELAAFMRSIACDKVIILIVIAVVLLAATFIILKIIFPDLFSVDIASVINQKKPGQVTPRSS
jgi:hypothetical protein